jgi:hypothetical protein
MKRSTICRRATAILVASAHLLLTTGCTSWQTQAGTVETVLATHPQLELVDTSHVSQPLAAATTTVSASSIRIATTSYPQMRTVTAPHIAGDSLFGMMEGSDVQAATPLDEITAVQIQKGSTGKTVALVTGLTIIIGLGVGSTVALSKMCFGIGC